MSSLSSTKAQPRSSTSQVEATPKPEQSNTQSQSRRKSDHQKPTLSKSVAQQGQDGTTKTIMDRWMANTEDVLTQGREAPGWNELVATDELAAEIDDIARKAKDN